jgi:ATP-dependent exoDNAse (exonuclease V) beta subunit
MYGKNFEVYRTSAGAGKTYTIVREFIRLNLMNRSNIDSTAAITFTNKAANEMKDRILEYLFAISQNRTERREIASMIDELGRTTGMSKEEIVTSSGKMLHEILHQYSRFSISTIDSFVHDILRTFSHDLKLPENFSVEIDTDMLTETIVSELLSGLVRSEDDPENTALSDYVVDLAMDRFENKDNWDISRELRDFAKLIFTENGMNAIPSVSGFRVQDFGKAAGRLQQLTERILHEIRKLGNEAMEAINSSGLDENDFYYKVTGIAGFFMKAARADRFTELKANSYVLRTIQEGKWASQSDDIPDALKHKLTGIFFSIENQPLKDFLPFIQHLNTQLGPMALLSKMQQILQEYNITNQSIPIAEFNKHISEVVRNEPAPFIYERLGQKYKHFLIDEFQDTSVSQWLNFLPLVENSISQNNHVMIVGDVKQSIYRFRNGEMEQLMRLPLIYDKPAPQHFDDIETTLQHSFSDKSRSPEFTNTNYRSGQYIVELNNLHFEAIRNLFIQNGSNHYIADAYENLSQLYAAHAEGTGEVCFYPVEEEQYRESTLNAITNIVLSYERKSDIAILCRGNATAKQIAAHLMQQDPPIPVISSESLELGFSSSVRFIIDMLGFINDPGNNIAITGAFFFLQFNTTQVSSLYPTPESWLNDLLTGSFKGNYAAAFHQLLNDAGYNAEMLFHSDMPVSEMVSLIIQVLVCQLFLMLISCFSRTSFRIFWATTLKALAAY